MSKVDKSSIPVLQFSPSGSVTQRETLSQSILVERALAPTRRAELLHAIDWHHGPPPGQPPGGAGAEALALWRANQLETTVKSRLEGPGPVEP